MAVLAQYIEKGGTGDMGFLDRLKGNVRVNDEYEDYDEYEDEYQLESDEESDYYEEREESTARKYSQRHDK